MFHSTHPMFHSFGSMCSFFLSIVVGEDVNDSHEVNLLLHRTWWGTNMQWERSLWFAASCWCDEGDILKHFNEYLQIFQMSQLLIFNDFFWKRFVWIYWSPGEIIGEIKNKTKKKELNNWKQWNKCNNKNKTIITKVAKLITELVQTTAKVERRKVTNIKVEYGK